jgi:hypothetical protein
MIYKTTKTVTDWEFQKIYSSNQLNMDIELSTGFKSKYPNHTIINSLGYLINNEDNTKTYDLTISYELS